MKKPSSSILLFAKLIFYFQILLPHVKCQTAATDLGANEVEAINTIINELKPKKVSVDVPASYCQNTGSSYGFSIVCNCTIDSECHITELTLSNLGSSGNINEAVGDLPHLTTIVLSKNNIQGNIPTTLGTLPSLTTLDLSNNRLTGPIPDTLGNLRTLEWLYLQKNSLDGSIPSSLGKLTNLKEINLDFNKLTGSIPDELGDLTNLVSMRIAENKLTGNIPSTLGKLRYLERFWLPSNLLTGNLSSESFAELRSMTVFGVAGNKLSGPLPTYVKNWIQVKSLVLLGNHFEGPVPMEYFQLQTLQFLLISDLNTSTTFQLPLSAQMNSIYSLVLRNCSIKGSIPKYISEEISSLKYLDLSFNKLTGGMPDGMKSNLIYMSFARNQLTGKIPEWIFEASRVRMDLSYNSFSELDAPVPSELDLNLFACCCCKSTSYTQPYMLQPVQMMETYFHEQKPKFHNLFINCGGEQTTVDGNYYDAENETARFHVSSLMNWAFSSSGDFFVEPENASDYIKRLPCKIANSETSLYDEARLSPVSLNYYGLSLHEGLYNVTLHFAEIVYTEDVSDYNSLRKRVFDVYIQDELVLKDFNIKAQAGGPNEALSRTFPTLVNKTKHLLNIHLYWAGKGSSYTYPPSYNGPLVSAISVKPTFNVDDGKLPPWAIALICVGSLVFVLLLFLALAWRLGWLEDKELGEEIEMTEFEQNPTVKELIKATKNFSNKIGTGSLGEVYEANLRDKKVAVKKLSSHFKKKIIDIKVEIMNMRALSSHPNYLISMLGVHIGERLQLIVYEYMENKSLEDVLFGSKFSRGDLKWETRLQICIDIVKGLQELHDRHQKPHGNIKLTNILLDKNNRVKLSDYGMADAYTEEDKILIVKENAPKGNMAPEFFSNVPVYTMKSDIYSIGMIILTIVSGRKCVEDKKDDQGVAFLLNDAMSLNEKNKLIDLVDKKLDNNFKDNQAKDILELALDCTKELESERPEISQVLKGLEDLGTPPPATSKEGGTADSGDSAERIGKRFLCLRC